MKVLFAFEEMFRPHIKDSGIKLPEDLSNFKSEEFPHLRVFLNLYLDCPMDLDEIMENAKIIASVSDTDILTITGEQLSELGVNLHVSAELG